MSGSLPPAQLDASERTALRSSLWITIALLAAQGWTFTQSAYVRQEIQDRLWPFAALIGMVSLVGSILMLRQERWLARAGVVCSVVSIALALHWILVPRAIIN